MADTFPCYLLVYVGMIFKEASPVIEKSPMMQPFWHKKRSGSVPVSATSGPHH